MVLLVVPLFITSFIHSRLPSTIYSMFSICMVLRRMWIWNGVGNKCIPRFMYLLIWWKSETKLRKKELHGVVSECLGSGVCLLGLKALPHRGSLTPGKLYLSVSHSPHLYGDDRIVLRINSYKAFRTVPCN